MPCWRCFLLLVQPALEGGGSSHCGHPTHSVHPSRTIPQPLGELGTPGPDNPGRTLPLVGTSGFWPPVQARLGPDAGPSFFLEQHLPWVPL